MLKQLLVGSALSLVSCGAIAADLPTRVAPAAPIVAAPAFTWTGFYVGAHAGYAWGGGTSAYNDPQLAPFDINSKPIGINGGLQAGFNYQVGNVVVGVEGDISLANVTDTIADNLGNFLVHPACPCSITTKTDYAGSLRARLGYSFGPVLPYVTGGYTWSHVKISATDGPVSTSATFGGWTIGAGLEYALSANVSVKAEYLHTSSASETIFAGERYASTAKPKSDLIRLGVNYKFGGSSPVVARY